MFGLIAQANPAAAALQENALTSVTDPDWTSQNSQFIFTGPVRLLADLAVGASVEYGRYNVAEWNGRGRPNIFAVNRNANPTSPLFWQTHPNRAITLPQNQQIQSLLTNNLASGTEAEYILWKIASSDWSANLPPTVYNFVAHATATVTPTVGAWVMNNAITFDQLPLGGVYAVLGARVVGANGIAFRLSFPRSRQYLGRRMRPGDIILPAFGGVPPLFSASSWGSDGIWGFFQTFELPYLDILGSAATSTTYHLFLNLGYLGGPESILDQMVATNY